jgi:integrase
MARIYHRGDSPNLWGVWTDGAGVEQRGSLETDDEDLARARVDALERDAHAAGQVAPGELTVEGFFRGEWLPMRKKQREFAWKDDESALTHHFLPTFGARPLRWLETDDGERGIQDWLLELPDHRAKRDGERIGTHTVWNIASIARVLCRDAKSRKRLARNPFAELKLGEFLPEKADKNQGWREAAFFDLEQVVALTTDPRLQAWRRVWNTLAFMTGARTGELAELRWSDITERYKDRLNRLTIARAFHTRTGKVKCTKTGATKIIPEHPYLTRTLLDWHDAGFREYTGRDPEPDDLIVPNDIDGRQWTNGPLLKRHYKDLELLGISKQRQYENRATFRNLLICAGAQEFHVNLMTHSKKEKASDFYTRIEQQWPALCDAILKLDHQAWRSLDGGTLAVRSTGTGPGGGGEPLDKPRLVVVPPARLERAAYGLGIRENSGPDRADSLPDLAASGDIGPEAAWMLGPDRPAPLPDVPGEQLVDDAFESECWARDARLAHAELAG